MVLNMKTNKLFLILSSLFISVSTLVACNTTNNAKQYYLHVDSVDSSICPDLPKSGLYNEKDKISFKVKTVADEIYYAFLNGERLYGWQAEVVGGDIHYEFEMPSMESYLTINSNLFYQDREYTFNEVSSSVGPILAQKEFIVSVQIVTEDITSEDVLEESYDKRDIDYNLNILQNEKLVKTSMPSKSDYKHTKTIYFIYDNGNKSSIRYIPVIEYWDFSNPTFFTFANGESSFRINYPVPPSIEC